MAYQLDHIHALPCNGASSPTPPQHDAAHALSQGLKEKLVTAITSDEDVLFQWCMTAANDLEEEQASVLLNRIVQLWVISMVYIFACFFSACFFLSPFFLYTLSLSFLPILKQ